MFVPKKSIKSLKHQELFCKDSFNVLCWNVAKLTLKSSYKEYLHSLVENEKIDILLLQEVKQQISASFDMYDYSYILSPNIQTKKYLFGVLSAFKISCEDALSLLTKKRELTYATHKVALVTEHKMCKGQKLLIVNLHAINFVRNIDFYNELHTIKTSVQAHKGSMIIAGDFNTWNLQRVKFLNEFASELSLKEVRFSDDSNLKKIFTNSLDYIFYRDLELISSQVIDSKKISDHNPILATFKCITL
ncbi:endonuclease/exonuclease/phosphatase family protein [bacterium]|nr:endonuclease/exonuclease/phosphatase family protein [bacterium]MBU1993986.1 endonuclease/exonuclease/phosphatase family protein [bacterium]